MKNPYIDDNGVLRNKFGISKAALLADVEYGLTTQRLYSLQEHPIKGDFDLAHLQAIHKAIVGDLYEWAGKQRTVNVSKRSITHPGYEGVFADEKAIASSADALHQSVRDREYLKDLNPKHFADSMASHYADWNKIHPFPEANGRALQIMMAQLAQHAGQELDFAKVDPDRFRAAVAESLGLQHERNTALVIAPDLKPLVQIIKEINTPQIVRGSDLEPIRLMLYPQADRQAVQQAVVSAAMQDPDSIIRQYVAHALSFDGRYVSADLFKEQFAQFTASKDARDRYNAPVHNTAAVLSAELFRRNLAQPDTPSRDTVLFVTGTPGAGKTTTVLGVGEIPPNVRMIFEGQLSNPTTTLEKIQQVLDAGLKPVLFVVHALPEWALDNTLHRFNVQGRGASIHVMADIHGKLADSLAQVQTKFGDQVGLEIIDKRDPAQDVQHIGWQHLDLLRSEGNHEQIKQRLTKYLEARKENGSITAAAFRQASGATHADRGDRLGQEGSRGEQPHEERPEIRGRDR